MLAIGLTFVVAGFVLLPSNPDVAVVTLAMFGSCTALFATQIARKRRDQAFDATRVAVIGGVPIRESKNLGILIGLWLTGLGAVLLLFSASYPPLFRWLSAAVALAGIALLLLVATGRYARGYLQFDPEALTIGTRTWRALIPWDNLAAVSEVEWNNNPVLAISVQDPSVIDIQPPEHVAAARKAIANNHRWMGTDFAILTTHYRISLPMIAAAVSRYAGDPAARAELAKPEPQPMIPPGSG